VPPGGWYEVVVNRTVLFACTLGCAQRLAAGHVGADVKVLNGPQVSEG
jgi:hypothetical protein